MQAGQGVGAVDRFSWQFAHDVVLHEPDVGGLLGHGSDVQDPCRPKGCDVSNAAIDVAADVQVGRGSGLVYTSSDQQILMEIVTVGAATLLITVIGTGVGFAEGKVWVGPFGHLSLQFIPVATMVCRLSGCRKNLLMPCVRPRIVAIGRELGATAEPNRVRRVRAVVLPGRYWRVFQGSHAIGEEFAPDRCDPDRTGLHHLRENVVPAVGSSW